MVITKFKKKPLDYQLKVGDFYICPFTSEERIWLGDHGVRRYDSIDTSDDVKKCAKRLFKLKQYKDAHKKAADILLAN
jgi:hypothetical protein